MKKRLTGFIIGTLLFTLITGTAALASESNNGASSKAAEETKQTIAMEDAVKIAMEDAKAAETDAAVYKQIWEYSDNAEIFEIDFLIPGQMKFEYEIAADTGTILENDKEAWDANDDREYEGLTPGRKTDFEKAAKALEEAADTAFKDAGVKKDDVIICKQGTDFENGREVYVVEFLQEGNTKYEYEIAAADGAIVFREQEPWEAEDDFEYKGLLHPETVQENKDGEGTGKISKTEAKEIALRDAGLSENDVTITKCRIDFDDGVEKYEVEFRTADGYEYEYEIDVETGKILDKDVELDD
ncbi:MAG: PepSY domain-containing protein [Lachnospiraceae bacterium]|nr:PepSY domain-containing protein [Lachnospiraceae bacterium]